MRGALAIRWAPELSLPFAPGLVGEARSCFVASLDSAWREFLGRLRAAARIGVCEPFSRIHGGK